MSHKGLVVITGASSGIGRATAVAAVAAEYRVLLLARRADRLAELVAELGEDKAMAATVDVTKLQALQEAIAAAEERFGPTRVLVNNAGVMKLGNVVDQDPSEWATMLDTNVTGVMNGCKAVVAGMVERQEGTIINVSSIAGLKSFASHAAYCASKFAVHGFTETLRAEVAGSSVRVSLVSPGVVETELLGHTSSAEAKEGYEAWKKTELKSQPLTAKDIADTILFVAGAPKHVCIRDVVIAPTLQVA